MRDLYRARGDHMIIKQKYFKNKFFISLFSVLLIFVIFSMLSLSFLYFNNIEKKITSIYSEYNEDSLYQSKSLVEHIYESLNESGKQIYTNESALKLIYSNEPLTMNEKSYLDDWIRQIKSSSPIIHSVTLYIQDSSKIYDTNYGYCNFMDFPDYKWIKDNNSLAFYQIITDEKRTLRNSITGYVPDTEVLSIMYTLPYTSNYTSKIIINVDIDSIHADVMSRTQNSSDINFAIINDQNQIILGDDQDPILTSVLNKELRYSTVKEELTAHMGEDSYIINTLPSDLYRWNFIWVSSTSNLTEIFSNLRLTLLIGSSTMLILIIGLAIFVAKKATAPMDELLNRLAFPKESFHFIKNMKQNIESTISENATINKKLQTTSSIYKERTLYSLLTSNENDVSIKLELLEGFNIKFLKDYYYVLTIELLNLHELNSNHADIYKIQKDLGEKIISTYPLDTYDCELVSTDVDMISIIINTSKTDFTLEEKTVSYCIKSILNTNISLTRIEIACGISQRSNDVNHLHTLYLQSIKALSFRYLNHDNSILTIDEVSTLQQTHLLYEINDAFENNLISGNVETSLLQLKRVISRLTRDSKVSISDFQQFVLQVLSIALRVSLKSRINISTNTYLSKDIWQLTSSIKTVYAAEDILSNIIIFISDEINNLQKDNDHIHLHNILEYIDLHYTDNLSMDMVSEATNISSSYIYKIIKENLDQTFVEYITDKRLQAACKLLKSNALVKDVAVDVGFNNSKYFTHVFKKHFGMTPCQYKNTLKV